MNKCGYNDCFTCPYADCIEQDVNCIEGKPKKVYTGNFDRKKYYQKNKEKLRTYYKSWYAKNRKEVIARVSANYKRKKG